MTTFVTLTLVFVGALAISAVLLFKSMNNHLKKAEQGALQRVSKPKQG